MKIVLFLVLACSLVFCQSVDDKNVPQETTSNILDGLLKISASVESLNQNFADFLSLCAKEKTFENSLACTSIVQKSVDYAKTFNHLLHYSKLDLVIYVDTINMNEIEKHNYMLRMLRDLTN